MWDHTDLDEAELLNGTFRLRRATHADLTPIVRMFAADPLSADRGAETGTAASLEPYRKAYEAIAADPAHLLLVAVDGQNDIAGTMQLTLLPCLAAGGATRLQIEAVHVRSDLQSKALGAAMLAWAMAAGRREGAGLAQLQSNSRRAAAHRFYQRLGFQPSHVGFKYRY